MRSSATERQIIHGQVEIIHGQVDKWERQIIQGPSYLERLLGVSSTAEVPPSAVTTCCYKEAPSQKAWHYEQSQVTSRMEA